MDEHLTKHDGEIKEVRDILVAHIADENNQVTDLKKDLNGNLAKIHTALLRMEPVIKKFEDDLIVNERAKTIIGTVIRYGGFVTSSAVLLYAVRSFIRNGF